MNIKLEPGQQIDFTFDSDISPEQAIALIGKSVIDIKLKL